jgi:hypothetical protein
MTAPYLYPDLYRSIVLGKAVSPGVVTLSGHDREASWEVAEAKGQTGASSTLNGSPVGEFQASFYLASVEDQIAWPAFQRVIESTVNGPEPVALPVYHPDLAANRFTEVCGRNVGGIVRDSNGGVTVLVKFIEYRPAKTKPSSGAKASPGSGSDDADSYDPNEERRNALEDLLAEASEA